jgi:RimJ/RimL family protein N-acetyltransferase
MLSPDVETTPVVLTPYVETQRVVLRPAGSSDGEAVYDLLLRLGLHSLPSMESFLKTFDRNAAAMFAIHLRHNDELIGFGSLQQLDRNGHIQVGIFTDVAKARYGVGGEAMMLLVNYAFATWDHLRKVYFLTTEASLDSFGSALGTIPKEATLPQHSYFAGKLWDLHWYAVYRATWEQIGATVLARLVQGPQYLANA